MGTPIDGPGLTRTAAYDRYGRQVLSGDVVYLMGKTDIMWKVVHVKPIFDPKVPPGTVEIALQAVFITGMPGGQPIGDLLKVRDRSEFSRQPADDAPPPADPPVVQ